MADWAVESLKSSIEAGWKLREEGEYVLAISHLSSAIFQANQLMSKKHKTNDNLWWILAEANNHLGITYKILYRKTKSAYYAIQSKHSFLAALDILKINNPTKSQLGIQLMHAGESCMISNDFEQASIYFEQSVNSTEKQDIASIAYIKSHLGISKFLQGTSKKDNQLKSQGKKLVIESKNILSAEVEQPSFPDKHESKVLNIWLTGSLLHLCKITSLTDIKSAKSLAKQALKISNANQLKIRIEQSNSLLEILNSSPKDALFKQ